MNNEIYKFFQSTHKTGKAANNFIDVKQINKIVWKAFSLPVND